MQIATSRRITRECFAGGTNMAMNMPYKPTDSARTMASGRMLPMITPRQVPIAQPGHASAIAP